MYVVYYGTPNDQWHTSAVIYYWIFQNASSKIYLYCINRQLFATSAFILHTDHDWTWGSFMTGKSAWVPILMWLRWLPNQHTTVGQVCTHGIWCPILHNKKKKNENVWYAMTRANGLRNGCMSEWNEKKTANESIAVQLGRYCWILVTNLRYHLMLLEKNLEIFRWKRTFCCHWLTHWGRVTHICVSKLTIIGSDNGLSPGRRQAIIWTNAGLLLIRTLETHFTGFWSEVNTFSLRKMRLIVPSWKWRPFCLGLNVLTYNIYRAIGKSRSCFAINTAYISILILVFEWFAGKLKHIHRTLYIYIYIYEIYIVLCVIAGPVVGFCHFFDNSYNNWSTAWQVFFLHIYRWRTTKSFNSQTIHTKSSCLANIINTSGYEYAGKIHLYGQYQGI